MHSSNQTQVLVVGAGPVGLFTALALKQQGLDVAVIDAEQRRSAHSYALALHPHSLALFQEVGVAQAMLRQGLGVDAMTFYDHSASRAQVSFSQLGGSQRQLLIMPQAVLEGLLEERLRELGVSVLWRHRLVHLMPLGQALDATVERWGESSSGYAVATTQRVVEKTSQWQAEFVVGADGHDSTVRRMLNIDCPRLGDSEPYAVFEFESDEAPGAEARVVLGPHSTDVLWPLPSGRQRWSFQSPGPEELEGPRVKSRYFQLGRSLFPQLTRDKLVQLAQARAPWYHATIRDVRWAVEVRFERRLAAAMGRGRAWLVGDAAHLTPPVGCRSINVGLCEGLDLARRLASLHRGTPAEKTLEDYNNRWLEIWRQLLGLEPSMTPVDDADPWVRDHAQRLLACLPASGEDLRALASQLGLTPIHRPLQPQPA